MGAEVSFSPEGTTKAEEMTQNYEPVSPDLIIIIGLIINRAHDNNRLQN